MKSFILLGILVVSIKGWSVGPSVGDWPDDSSGRCSQYSKQKAMYGKFQFQPSLKEKPFTKMSVQVRMDDLSFNPISNADKRGGVYISYAVGLQNGPSGYFGLQAWNEESSLIFSMWDGGRWEGTGSQKQPKPASKLTWPMMLQNCTRNCQDCGLRYLRELKGIGLTTGTKCVIDGLNIKVGDRVEITLKRSPKKVINTKDFGGMSLAHKKLLGEVDRDITGYVWTVKAKNMETGEKWKVGRMMIEGDDPGMDRIGTFDEMIGCNKCNSIHHKDTRWGPFLSDADGTKRKPYEFQGMTRASDSTCKKYKITGSADYYSTSFEGGPFTATILDGTYHTVWKKKE